MTTITYMIENTPQWDLTQLDTIMIEQLMTAAQIEMGHRREQERQRALKVAQDALAAAGITMQLSDVIKGQGGHTTTTGAAKYANPDDSSETWTGRGRKPNWFITYVENGGDPANIEISDASSADAASTEE
jgi:DNA-binding protein H-NS